MNDVPHLSKLYTILPSSVLANTDNMSVVKEYMCKVYICVHIIINLSVIVIKTK